MKRAHVPNATLSFRELFAALARPISVSDAESEAASFLGVEHVILFASARGALATTIEALATNCIVALPAYTCAAVANAVLSGGARPIYVDVDGRGLAYPADWPHDASVAIAQDTYGFASALPEGIDVVRDAAHRVDLVAEGGARVAVTSFEHSKWLSAGEGGLAVAQGEELASRMRALRDRHQAPASRFTHVGFTIVATGMGRLDYRGHNRAARSARRVAYHLCQPRLAGQTEAELNGLGVSERLRGRPNESSCRLILSQLAKASDVAEHRRGVVTTYDQVFGVSRAPEPLVRYPVRAANPTQVEDALAASGWEIRGGWFRTPLHPAGDHAHAFGYVKGSAQMTEALAASVLNLPTHPLVKIDDAEQLATLALDAGCRPLT